MVIDSNDLPVRREDMMRALLPRPDSTPKSWCSPHPDVRSTAAGSGVILTRQAPAELTRVKTARRGHRWRGNAMIA